MELENKEHLQDECAAMAVIQGCALYNQDFGGPSLIHTSSNSSPENHSRSSTNSNGFAHQPSDYSVAVAVVEENNSVAAFNSNLIHVVNAGSLLSFDQTSSHHAADEQWAWLNDEDENGVQEVGSATASHKRPSTGKALQALKKQCVAAPSKPKVAPECKDPQSVAAKNRRERISERLKTLQELVPNGSKVDLVSMLEKAISYVKFLQLQVTVLATDEFWAVQGGKAPDISQVREAIDEILVRYVPCV